MALKKFPGITVCEIVTIDLLDSKLLGRKTDKLILARELFVTDIQALFCRIIINQKFHVWPRWCKFRRSQNIGCINLVVVKGISAASWESLLTTQTNSKIFEDELAKFSQRFSQNIDFVDPVSYGLTWKFELFNVPSAFLVEEKCSDSLRKRNHSDNSTVHKKKAKYDTEINDPECIKHKDAFGRSKLVLTKQQMVEEEIPVFGMEQYKEFKNSKRNGYLPLTDFSPIFAIDCEMVNCAKDSKLSREVVSVSIVNESGTCVYNTYVKPGLVIMDYLTRFSGVDEATLTDVSTSLADVHHQIDELLPADAILVGHSICSDLTSLRLFHPYIIDTSVIYHLVKKRQTKAKLRDLALTHLERSIQTSVKTGHDSSEDALACMDLVLLKLRKDLAFGDALQGKRTKGSCSKQQPEVSKHPELCSSHLPVLSSELSHIEHRTVLLELIDKDDLHHLVHDIIEPSIKSSFCLKQYLILEDEWIPQEHLDFVEEQDKQNDSSTGERLHPFSVGYLNYGEISNSLIVQDGESPMAQLLKKASSEFDRCPPSTLCALMFIEDSSEASSSTSYGRFFFGITPPPPPTMAH